MAMVKNRIKEIAIGFLIGIITNILGALLYILLFSDLGVASTIEVANEGGHLGSIIALGAILNIAAFFGFLKIKRDYRARGVMIASLLAAILILIYKIFM